MSPTVPALGDRSHLPSGAGGVLAGPWEQAFWFALAEGVQSKANARRGERRATGSARSRQNAGFELAVRSAAREYRPLGWDAGDPAVPVAARPKLVTFIYGRSLLDAGNLDKSILDGLQGAVMANDAQVCWTGAQNVRDSRNPGVVVAVARLPRTATVAEQNRAGVALSEQVIALLSEQPR